MSFISSIILAGGRGTRMLSPTPKMLIEVAGSPLIRCVASNLASLNLKQMIIVGSNTLFQQSTWKDIEGDIKTMASYVDFVIQEQPLGTGHAALKASSVLAKDVEKIVICNGDTPFVLSETFKKLCNSKSDLAIATMKIQDPISSSFGRVCFKDKRPYKIIEAKDVNEELRSIDTANAGIYVFSAKCFKDCICCLDNKNAANEYYITQLLEIANNKGYITDNIEIDLEESYGINTIDDLVKAPTQNFLRKKALQKGVTFSEINSVILSFDTQFEGKCEIQGFNVFGKNVKIKEGARIFPYCYLENCIIESNCSIGPFAHIKANSNVGADCVIGNFVEIKNSNIKSKTKIKHLSYIGDTEVGSKVNVGAGTIVCNYDGFKKYKTTIKDSARIGANTSLVAPLTIGENAFIGAGSVITKDVPDRTLALSRSKQEHNNTWLQKKLDTLKTD